MKSAIALHCLLVGGASAFVAPRSGGVLPSAATTLSAASPSAAEEEAAGKAASYPTVNGWTADPDKFCAGLPGAVAPLGDFDPLGFTRDLPVQEIKRFREAEVTHGRVAMLAVVGYLVAENFHPFFNGLVSGPANTHLSQVREIAPFFFAWLGGSIATAELFRAKIGWEFPTDAMSKNAALRDEEDFEGQTWLSKLNDRYYPGDLRFDPLNLKPTSPADFEVMQTKELNNGRLAMIASIGMIVQEQVTHSTLF
mmetsp:Transcript_29461/g.63172  ORF Transcript_29461/g.63172 Transcript_29461/m.63172 type:complete len:253 (+) Transcript_29461:178-936(+)|eukprot:CAMPEP_0201233596 /NCGR_PEP_ID=MMETSP0852-20130820/5427_1 /ASSEMBLY_ACC=CAM_ASM_000632 /TAXON_ID=183588 /ORGANISM="Pseudo-nitzschia fraudulenta, Strain WWA7" /LENGTH=252 /DNA_ID=CAMNT_0047526549 /DNA_START=158 /DNA_END=916 /DNA_ORIENTATION=+